MIFEAFNRLTFALALAVLIAGCDVRPVVHKPVKRRPPSRNIPSTVAIDQYTALRGEPGLLRDDQVRPAQLILPTFEERTEQQVAAEALSRIGPPAVPELILALQSSDPHVRREAADVLSRLGPDAKDAVPDLIRLLDDEDLVTRKMAAKALGRIGPDAAPAVPALMRTLLQSPAPPRP